MFESEVPTVILSGGQSRRMDGNDKAFISIKNQTLLEIVIERLRCQTQNIAINTNSNYHSYFEQGLPILPDEIKGFLGPLAGVLTAMTLANNMGYKEVATVAVDTPLFPKNLVQELFREMKDSNSDIVFAESASNNKHKSVLHPVFGLWKTSLSDDLKMMIENGTRKVTSWSERHNVSSVYFTHELIDPFFNINTLEDIKLVREYIRNK